MVLTITEKFFDHLCSSFGVDEKQEYDYLVENIARNVQWTKIICDFDFISKMKYNVIAEVFLEYSPEMQVVERDELKVFINSNRVYQAMFDDALFSNFKFTKEKGTWVISPSTISIFLNQKFKKKKEFSLDRHAPSEFKFTSFSAFNEWKHFSSSVLICDRYVKGPDALRNNLKPLIEEVLIFKSQEVLHLHLAIDFSKVRSSIKDLENEVESWSFQGLKTIELIISDLGSSKNQNYFHSRFFFSDYLTIQFGKGIELFDSKKRLLESNDSITIETNFTQFSAFRYKSHLLLV